jgi:phosphomethylpyrimidine synthase
MSKARRDLDWESMLNLAMDPRKAKRYREQSMPYDSSVCTMCGEMCAVKRSRKVLGDRRGNGEKV